MIALVLVILALAVPARAGVNLPVLRERSRNEMRGIWAECQGRNSTPSSSVSIEEMFRRLRTARINTVFMQVYRGNRAWYPSRLADSSPYRDFRAKEKTGPLRIALDRAHANGMELHAWLNAFRVWGAGETKVLARLGRDAVIRDSGGKNLLDYGKGSLPDGGYWLDPGDPKVRAYLCDVIREILDLYPDLDGIHLDYTRYPFKDGSAVDFGYGRASVKSFRQRYGFDPAGCTGSKRALWDAWRREQVTAFVTAAKKIVEGRGKKLSVATIPDERKSLSTAFQDWPRWVRGGIVDFIVPMNYSADRDLVSERARAIVKTAGARKKVAMGIGAYKVLDRPGDLKGQIGDCLKQGVAGVVLFSYDNLTRRPELFPFLGRNVFKP